MVGLDVAHDPGQPGLARPAWVGPPTRPTTRWSGGHGEPLDGWTAQRDTAVALARLPGRVDHQSPTVCVTRSVSCGPDGWATCTWFTHRRSSNFYPTPSRGMARHRHWSSPLITTGRNPRPGRTVHPKATLGRRQVPRRRTTPTRTLPRSELGAGGDGLRSASDDRDHRCSQMSVFMGCVATGTARPSLAC